MATISSLMVLLGMDTKGLTAGVTKAEGELAGLGTSTNKFSQISNAAFTGLGIAAVAGIAVSIKAASDLNEQINKSNVVFEDSADAVISWSETTATSLGIAQSEALESAGAFGQLFEAAGFVPSAAAEMSQSMVQLSADLGSFNNIPVAEALEKIRGGLAGEAEPLRALGVFLSEAAVKTEAYRSGIAKQGAELTDAQKIQARYNIILAQTTKAQGDFARTVGTSIPNQLKVMKAELQDTAAAVGKDLLPGVLSLLRALKSLMPVIGPIAKNLDLLVLAIGAFVVGSKLAAAGATNFGAALGPITLAITTAIGVGRALNDVWFGLDTTVDELVASLTGQLEPALESGAITIHQYAAASAALHNPSMENVRDLLAVSLALEQQQIALEEEATMKAASAAAADTYVAGLQRTAGAIEGVADTAERTFPKFSKAAKDIKQSIAAEIPGIIGTVTTMKDAFSISPAELVKITRTWAQIAKRIAADLVIIADSDLKPAMREAISALPPEMRDAWARGTAKERKAIEASYKKALAIDDLIPGLAADALRGGTTLGHNLDTGVARGISAGTSVVTGAAKALIEAALRAMHTAADAASPSKKTMALGHDLMQGLANGISDAEEVALKAAQKAIEDTIKGIEKRIERVSSALDKIKSKASAFRDTIAGAFSSDLAGPFAAAMQESATAQAAAMEAEAAQEGFSGEFSPWAGPDFSSIIQGLVSEASALADVLDALRRQGASKDLLTQVAESGIGFGQALLQGGPAQISEANQALQDIAKYARDTGKDLTKVFFGKSIDEVTARLDVLHEDLKTANQQDKVVINIQGWVGNDQDIAKRVRDELVKLGKRNVTTGI